MTAPQKFRSALNGFNREDVVHYIEYTNARHEAEMGQLKEQLEFYRKELAVQDTTTRQAECDHLTELEEKCAALEQENEALRQQVATAVKQPSSGQCRHCGYGSQSGHGLRGTGSGGPGGDGAHPGTPGGSFRQQAGHFRRGIGTRCHSS